MPYTFNRGVRLYWEQEGEGEPLLLIMGLGFSLAMWGDVRTYLARRFRLILFDNRGVGKSTKLPVRGFSIRAMARDAACVLDAAGLASAHVLGISMGGMIAQELTIREPQRVRRLVLACTHCGHRRSVRPAPEVVRALFPKPWVSPEARLQALLPFLYDSHTPGSVVERDAEAIRRNRPDMRGVLGQLWAIVRWDSYSALPQITAPTLVIHGETDRLIPPANAAILAERIPGAHLVMLPRAGHIFPSEQPALTQHELLNFLTAPMTVGT